MDEENRWSGFEDDEIAFLANATDDYDDVHVLSSELVAEERRREDRRVGPTYQGPGYYVDADSGTTMHVVGAATIAHVPCVLIGSSMQDPHLWAMERKFIEARRPDGSRRFTFTAAI